MACSIICSDYTMFRSNKQCQVLDSAKLRALLAHVPCVLTRQRVLHSRVPTFLACLCVLYAHVLTHYNFKFNKNKFSIKFDLDFRYFFFDFFLWHKTVYEKLPSSKNVSRYIYFKNSVVHSCTCLTRRKSLMAAMKNLIKWFDFSLGRALRVIF